MNSSNELTKTYPPENTNCCSATPLNNSCGVLPRNSGMQFPTGKPMSSRSGKGNKKSHYVPGKEGKVWPTSKVKAGLLCHRNVEHETWEYVPRKPRRFLWEQGSKYPRSSYGGRSNEE
ncbi:hypothetical protein NPIL_64521 [Nephila pilipes]|uniref:Uncharacterized protein n=1 Tax=Nephila pilipes TaxID=299642 RepID=A0A8X6NBM0_NEPPI|nr:hypothetical protein NPIL_64521 [Nephila pilipes]